jgi:hypothetical protein
MKMSDNEKTQLTPEDMQGITEKVLTKEYAYLYRTIGKMAMSDNEGKKNLNELGHKVFEAFKDYPPKVIITCITSMLLATAAQYDLVEAMDLAAKILESEQSDEKESKDDKWFNL